MTKRWPRKDEPPIPAGLSRKALIALEALGRDLSRPSGLMDDLAGEWGAESLPDDPPARIHALSLRILFTRLFLVLAGERGGFRMKGGGDGEGEDEGKGGWNERLIGRRKILDTLDSRAPDGADALANLAAEQAAPGGDPRLLGALYEALLGYAPAAGPGGYALERGSASRKSSGAYYTPSSIVKHMVDMALPPLGALTTEEILGLKVVDPAMGSGCFLLEAAARLGRAYARARVREGDAPAGVDAPEDGARCRRLAAANCLYGVDLDPVAVELARMSLWLDTFTPPGPNPLFDLHLEEGDALFGVWLKDLDGLRDRVGADARAWELYSGKAPADPKAAPRFFHWELAFPEVFDRRRGRGPAPGGFDAVLGNPPYGDLLSKPAKEALKRFGYPAAGGRADIHAPFLHLGLNLLAPQGRLCFIVPNTLLDGRQFSKLRKEITARARVCSVTDFRSRRVFRDAEVYSMVILLRSGAGTGGGYDAEYRCPAPGALDGPAERLRVHGDSPEPWRKRIPFVERLRASKGVEDLSDVAACRDGGLDYKYKSVGWSERGLRPSLGKMLTYTGPRRHPRDKPMVQGRDIEPYGIRARERYLVHDWERHRAPDRSILVYPGLQEVPVKILTRQTSDRLVAALDRRGRYTAKSVHTVIVENPRYTPEFVCALLNSRVMNRIYAEWTGETGRTFAQVKVSDLRRLPVRKMGSCEAGLAHPEWTTHRERVLAWVREARHEALVDFAERLLGRPRRTRPSSGSSGAGGSTAVIQVLVTELVRRMEERMAEEDPDPRALHPLAAVLDRIFDMLYGVTD